MLEEYFLGQTSAYGLFEDRFGKVRRQFKVDITGELPVFQRIFAAHEEARRRGIPVRRLNAGSLVQLGLGRHRFELRHEDYFSRYLELTLARALAPLAAAWIAQKLPGRARRSSA